MYCDTQEPCRVDIHTTLLLPLAGERPLPCSRMGAWHLASLCLGLPSALLMETILTSKDKPRVFLSVKTDSFSQEYFPLFWTPSAFFTLESSGQLV